jgi:hypothetical protein
MSVPILDDVSTQQRTSYLVELSCWRVDRNTHRLEGTTNNGDIQMGDVRIVIDVDTTGHAFVVLIMHPTLVPGVTFQNFVHISF